MAKSASLYINFAYTDYDPVELIKTFIKSGWIFNDNGTPSYLPVNDNDNFDWIFESISDEELYSIFQQKYLLKEIIGVSMTWQNTNIGGSFLFDVDKLIISLEINRKIFFKNITDMNWYIEKIIPCILSSNIIITLIKFEDG